MNVLKLFQTFAIGITSLLLTVGCERTASQKLDDANVELNKLVDTLKKTETDVQHALRLEWMRLRRESNAKGTANEKLIFDYKLKMVNANGKFSASYDKNIDDLEKRNKELQTKLLNFKVNDNISWELFKNEFNNEMDELSEAFKTFSLVNKK